MDEITALISERDSINRQLINLRTAKLPNAQTLTPKLSAINRRLRELQKLFPVEYQEAQYESTMKWSELYHADRILTQETKDAIQRSRQAESISDGMAH